MLTTGDQWEQTYAVIGTYVFDMTDTFPLQS